MPTKELFITRSSLKRKKQELIFNAPIKKARIQVMKELATKFEEKNLNIKLIIILMIAMISHDSMMIKNAKNMSK